MKIEKETLHLLIEGINYTRSLHTSHINILYILIYSYNVPHIHRPLLEIIYLIQLVCHCFKRISIRVNFQTKKFNFLLQKLFTGCIYEPRKLIQILIHKGLLEVTCILYIHYIYNCTYYNASRESMQQSLSPKSSINF